VLRQPLPEDWSTNDGCLNGQQTWREYETAWGVLAADEDEAREFATTWQTRCLPPPFEFIDVRLQGEDYEDSPGIVWQGLHQPASTDDDDEDGDDQDFDDDSGEYDVTDELEEGEDDDERDGDEPNEDETPRN
jgi:hypothetical protein